MSHIMRFQIEVPDDHPMIKHLGYGKKLTRPDQTEIVMAVADFDLMHADWTPETPEFTPVLLLLDLSDSAKHLPGATAIAPQLAPVYRLTGAAAVCVAIQVLGQASLEEERAAKD